MSQLFDQIARETPEHVRYFVDMSFDVADRIQALLKYKGLTQKDLAQALGKQESEVSKWLSGTHNFTLKTLSKITAVLGQDVIQVSEYYVSDILPISPVSWGAAISGPMVLEEITPDQREKDPDSYALAA